MQLFLDCEFNSYQGALISMALVSADGKEWYEVLECSDPDPWVKENVMPVLDKDPISKEEFVKSLETFLMQFDIAHIIADFPDDCRHFCDVLVTGPGERINTPPLFMQIIRDDYADDSKQLHNALADARAIRDGFIESRKGRS